MIASWGRIAYNLTLRISILFPTARTHIKLQLELYTPPRMPLAIYKRSPGIRTRLPISLTTTCYLILVLCCLQLIYLASFLLRPVWSSWIEFPPLKNTIEDIENLVVDSILTIVSFTNYNLPVQTSVLSSENLINRPVTAAYASRVTVDGIKHPVNPPYLTPPAIPECYPTNTLKHMQLNAQVRDPPPTPSTPVERYNTAGVAIYDTVERVTEISSSGRARVPSQHPYNSLRTPHDENGKVKDRCRDDEFEDAQMNVVRPPPPAAVYRPYYAPARMGQKSSAISLLSLDGPHDLCSAKESHTDSTGSGEGPAGVELGHKTKSHSTESYPGKFPVSEGMDFSELATAGYAFRERGTTTVRPFSDY